MSDTFVEGPAPQPAAPALAWCGEAGSKTLRLPILVERGVFGETATLGAEPGGAPLKLDSGALSRTLDDHLSDHCGTASPCAVWLEGTWGPLVGPSMGSDAVFAVRKVVGKVETPADAKLMIKGS